MHFVRFAMVLSGLVLALTSCGNPQVDGSMNVQTFDVGASGTDTCPGTLYAQASQGLARCSHVPEACHSESGASTIACTCAADDGGTGNWECHQQ
jgi:hypothetical protein